VCLASQSPSTNNNEDSYPSVHRISAQFTGSSAGPFLGYKITNKLVPDK
jgi:hypothetical protein